MNFDLGNPRPLTSEEIEAREQLQKRIAQNADGAILARAERFIHHRMVPLSPKLPTAMRAQPTHFDRLSDWYAGYLGVRGEIEAPYELLRDLKEQVPQAALRDIFRPVYNPDHLVPLEFQSTGQDPGGRQAFGLLQKALHREPIPTIAPVLLAVIALQRQRQRLFEQPWQPFYKDDAPRSYPTPYYGGA